MCKYGVFAYVSSPTDVPLGRVRESMSDQIFTLCHLEHGPTQKDVKNSYTLAVIWWLKTLCDLSEPLREVATERDIFIGTVANYNDLHSDSDYASVPEAI